MPEQPDGARVQARARLLAPPRLHVSARPGRHQRAQRLRSHKAESACYLGNYALDSKQSWTQICCVMRQKVETKNRLQLTDQQKRERDWRVAVQKELKNNFCKIIRIR